MSPKKNMVITRQMATKRIWQNKNKNKKVLAISKNILEKSNGMSKAGKRAGSRAGRKNIKGKVMECLVLLMSTGNGTL